MVRRPLNGDGGAAGRERRRRAGCGQLRHGSAACALVQQDGNRHERQDEGERDGPQAPLAQIGDYAFQGVHRTGEEIAAVGAGVGDEEPDVLCVDDAAEEPPVAAPAVAEGAASV